MDFDWDDSKAESNLKKHGIRFTEAATVWNDENALEMFDPGSSGDEERFLLLGYSLKATMLVIVFCERLDNNVVRIISARTATKTEQKVYHSR
jgi:uncharacterized DUF497 family protein